MYWKIMKYTIMNKFLLHVFPLRVSKSIKSHKKLENQKIRTSDLLLNVSANNSQLMAHDAGGI
jgi:hypothetical protein